jgi:hypothetical protein
MRFFPNQEPLIFPQISSYSFKRMASPFESWLLAIGSQRNATRADRARLEGEEEMKTADAFSGTISPEGFALIRMGTGHRKMMRTKTEIELLRHELKMPACADKYSVRSE